MAGRVPDYDHLSEEARRSFFESPLFKKYFAYRSLVDGIEALKDDGPMYESLRGGVLRRMGSIRSEDTVDEFFEALRAEVEEHTEFVEQVEDKPFEKGGPADG